MFDTWWDPRFMSHPLHYINLPFLRFRLVPTFSRDTIRRFGGSVSAMKKLAGQDFEDIMQVGASFVSTRSTS